MRKSLLCFCLLCLSIVARGQTSYEYAYWVDNDMASGRMSVTSGDSWQTDIDVSYLNEGFHSLHVQVRDEKGRWSSPVTRYFYKLPKADNMVYRYWFDWDNEPLVCNNEEVMWLDVSKLDDGMHTLHIQLGDEVSASVVNFHFLKIPQIVGVDYMTCLCYIDGNLYHQERVAQVGDVLPWTFDVSGMEEGIHSIRIQVVTPAGVASSVYESMFVRSITNDELASLDFLYTIDDKEGEVCEGGYMDGGYHFDLDVSALEDGIHKLSYTLVGDDGISTKFVSRFFVKSSLGGSGIIQYWYWLNDNEAEKTVVQLDEPANPYQLIGLLPVETVPIRSSLFHFEVDEKEGPMLYAKNEFHVRFYDATGRLVDATKPYVDYNVSEKVANIARLESTQTMPKPAEHEIKWYKFDAEVGDSIAFKADKACSINVFNAEGNEIYAASGSDAVNYGGGVIQEDGAYYVALHDVTTTVGTDITLDFLHMEKFAVLQYSPKNIGVTPSVMRMELFGNGYQHLKKAELTRGATMLVPDSVNVRGRTDAELFFILEHGNYERGAYALNLYFDDGEESEVLTIEDAIEFEEPVWGDIEISFTDKRALALPYPVSINVTNTGNVAYSLVPLYFAYDNVDHIQNVEFLDFGIGASKELFDAGYSPMSYTDNLFGKGVPGAVAATLITYLSPGETVSITPGFSGGGHTRFTLSAWTGTPWSMMTNDAVAARGSYARTRNVPYSTSCMPDPCEYLSLIDYVAETGNMIECGCALAMATIKAFANSFLAVMGGTNRELNRHYATDFEALGIEFRYPEYKLESPGDIVWGVLEHCLGNLGERLSMIREVQNLQNGAAEEDCPGREDYPVEILTPGDPNDIIGFKSEAGSKFVPSDIKNTHYTIRFENDPEIATTSAHVITVRDTLDGRYLDLSTFSPTSVCIGDRMLELDGEKSFTKTLDMRTRINAVAEISLDYDEAQGIAVWTIRSLDPMTMEETWDYMQGVLPVNSDGNGEGQISFDIKLREGLTDGTQISNRASIVFDNEAAVMTPTWTNTIDDTKPTSEFVNIVEVNDTVIQLNWQGSDDASELWKYTLAVQAGKDGKWSEFLTDTLATSCMLRYQRDIDYGFCVLATDSAGNVESTEWTRKAEFMRTYIAGDADKNGSVNLLDLNLTLSHILGNEVSGCDMLQMDANDDGSINVLDINAILQIILDADGEAATLRKRDNGVIRIINTKVL